MTFWKTAPFKALQQAWYKRLEELGFSDAEKLVGDDMALKQTATHPYRHKGKDQICREALEERYLALYQKFMETEFESEIEEIIISLHVEGKKPKEIREYLANNGRRRGRETVRSIIHKYEVLWGMKLYQTRGRWVNRKK